MILRLSDYVQLYPQQQGLVNAFVSGEKRYALRIAHRRYGKDFEAFTITWVMAYITRGVYIYFLPTIGQARHVIWDTIGKDGIRLRDRIPKPLVRRMNSTEQKIELINGSLIYVTGSDNYERWVGMNAKGIVWSEFQSSNPMARSLMAPMLALNKGWEIINGTPRAYNHLRETFFALQDEPSWIVTNYTAYDTFDCHGKPIVTDEIIEQERRNQMPEELIQQEYFGSWDAAIVGSYYGSFLKTAREEGRIGQFSYNPNYQVFTGWDLGMDDFTSWWVVQVVDGKMFFLEYGEACGQGMEFYVNQMNLLRRKYGWGREINFAPHDIEVRELGPGKSRKAQALQLGLRFNTVAAPAKKMHGIQAVRFCFKKFHFNEVGCKIGLKRLYEYSTTYNEQTGQRGQNPKHDEASHGADALQSFILGYMSAYDQENLRKQIEYANLYGV